MQRRTKLIEGEDFVRIHGAVVLTALYHLKRGKCCGHSCRNCPYDYSRSKVKPKRKYEKMEATLLIADRPNANGHIYSKEAIEQVKLQIEEHITSGIAFGVIHKDAQTPVLKLVDAAFRIEHPRIIENELKIDIIPISTSNGDLLKQNLNQFKFSMVGMGTINDDGTIDNVRYCYSSAILKY